MYPFRVLYWFCLPAIMQVSNLAVVPLGINHAVHRNYFRHSEMERFMLTKVSRSAKIVCALTLLAAISAHPAHAQDPNPVPSVPAPVPTTPLAPVPVPVPSGSPSDGDGHGPDTTNDGKGDGGASHPPTADM